MSCLSAAMLIASLAFLRSAERLAVGISRGFADTSNRISQPTQARRLAIRWRGILAEQKQEISGRLKIAGVIAEAYTRSCIAPRNAPAGGRCQMGAIPPVVFFQHYQSPWPTDMNLPNPIGKKVEERRATSRYKLVLLVEIRVAPNMAAVGTVLAETQDMSTQGFYFNIAQKFTIGTQFIFRLLFRLTTLEPIR